MISALTPIMAGFLGMDLGEGFAMIMFLVFMAMILTGYNVAFSFAATGVMFAFLGDMFDVFNPMAFNLLGQRWAEQLSNSTLLAVPLFVLMGAILERSGIAERLLTGLAMLMGPLPGGVAAAGVGIIGLFAGALIPGLLVSLMYAIYCLVYARMNPGSGPPMPKEDRTLNGSITAQTAFAISAVLGVLLFVVILTFSPLWAAIVGVVGFVGIFAILRTGSMLAAEVLVGVVPTILLILGVLAAIFQGIVAPFCKLTAATTSKSNGGSPRSPLARPEPRPPTSPSWYSP